MGVGRNARSSVRPLRRDHAEDFNAWLGKESGKPVHVATVNTDLAAELKRGLSFVRAEKNADKKQSRKAKHR
jgi:hypothetical protein